MSTDPDQVTERRALGTLPDIPGWAPWPVPTVLETTGSTMVDVEELAAAGAPEGSVVVAEEQTAGRGRRGRPWESARYAGLWSSLLLRPASPPEEVSWLPLVVGVGIARALRSVSSLPAVVKWPNDIVVLASDEAEPPRKLAGILAERLSDGSVVVGMGINVDHARGELPPGGTSLRLECGPVSREDVLVAVLSEVATAYRAWANGADAATDYATYSATLGRRVRVQTPVGDVVGIASGLGPHGELRVVDSEGQEHAITAGDVVHLRPAEG